MFHFSTGAALRLAACACLVFLQTGAFAQKLPVWGGGKALFAVINQNGKQGYIQKSADGGATWTTVWDGSMESKSTSKTCLMGIAQGNGKIVACGTTLLVSSDGGKSWEETIITGNNNENINNDYPHSYFNSVAYGDGMFLAVASVGSAGHIMYSPDGKNWHYVIDPNKPKAPGARKESGTDSNKKLTGFKGKLSVGGLKDAAKPGDKQDKEDYGDDGLGGTMHEGMWQKTDAVRVPNDVLFANGKFIVVGGSRAFEVATFVKQGDKVVLENAVDFTKYGQAANAGMGGFQRIGTDGKGTLVAVANTSRSAYSLDGGLTWKFFRHPEDQQAYPVAFGKGNWVSLSPFEDVYHSADITQGFQKLGTLSGRNKTGQFNDAIFANGRFIAVGHGSRVLVSLDGKKWEELPAPANFGMDMRALICTE